MLAVPYSMLALPIDVKSEEFKLTTQLPVVSRGHSWINLGSFLNLSVSQNSHL
jgi:hypothetical protein